MRTRSHCLFGERVSANQRSRCCIFNLGKKTARSNVMYIWWAKKQGHWGFGLESYSQQCFCWMEVEGKVEEMTFSCMMSWLLVHRGNCMNARLGFFFILFSSYVIAYPVIQEKQYEVIIVPTFLVTIFLILLGVILWLFIREQRTQQQRPGPRGKAQTLGLGRGLKKMEIRKKYGLSFNEPMCRSLDTCNERGMGSLPWSWEGDDLFSRKSWVGIQHVLNDWKESVQEKTSYNLFLFLLDYQNFDYMSA